MIIGNTDHVFSFPVQTSIESFGITVDDRLCFDEHFANICKKITNPLNVISRFRKLIPSTFTKHLYYHTSCIVLPYGSFVTLKIRIS